MSVVFTKSEHSAAIVPDRAPQDRSVDEPEPMSSLIAQAEPPVLTADRLLAAEAMRLLIRLDRNLMEARAQWIQDWFRRVMCARSNAATRLRRRWERIYPPLPIALGNLRRRYHANLAKYLYQPHTDLDNDIH